MSESRRKPKVLRRLRDTGTHYEKVSRDKIREALGAEEVASSRSSSPFTLHLPTVASFVKSELASSGGRPGRKGNIERKKIPITDGEWNKLVDLSAQLERKGITAAPGQVAGILLKYSLESVDRGQPLSSEESQEVEKQVDQILAAAASAGAPLSDMRSVAVELLRRMKSSRKEI